MLRGTAMTHLDDEPQTPLSVEDLFERVQPRIGRIFARFRLPVEDAEDILQQSFLDLVYKQGQIYNPEAWLVATVKNRCLVFWRRKRRQLWEAVDQAVLELLAEPASPGQGGAALRHDLERLLGRLPERCRNVLVLRYKMGYRPREVADLLGYQPTSIRKVTSRCIAALTRELVEGGFSPGERAPEGAGDGSAGGLEESEAADV